MKRGLLIRSSEINQVPLISDGNHQKHQDDVGLVLLLKNCAKRKDLYKGSKLHSDILERGLLKKNVFIGNALVNMYAKCGALVRAKEVFDQLPLWDVVSWNALIGGYAQHGQGQEALDCFERMQSEGFSPDLVTFASTVKACGSIGAEKKGEEIHDKIAKKGFLGNQTLLGNALVDMYAKWGALAKAREVFDELPVRDVISWTALIAGYAQHGHGEDALDCYQQMQKDGFWPDAVTFACILKACGSIGASDKGKEIHVEIARKGFLGKDNVLGNALVDMYARSGVLVSAQEAFNELTVRDIVSWNALIAGYCQHGYPEKAFDCFQQMKGEGLSPDEVTFTSVLKACGSLGEAERGKQVHDEIIHRGLLRKDSMLGNALLDMYCKCGSLAQAQQVFDECLVDNVVSWNVLIGGYCDNGCGEEAVRCFERMKHEGISADAITFACVLKACGSIGAAEKGQRLHADIIRRGLLGNDSILGNALVVMCLKCDVLAKAQQVFDELPVCNAVSWNALIVGYCQHHHDDEALKCFDRMTSEGLFPDTATLVYVLNSCGSVGTFPKGIHIHAEIMRRGLFEQSNVLTALVDMYASHFAFARAQQVLDELSVQDVAPWNALIARYHEHGYDSEALICFERMKSQGPYPDTLTFATILQACGSSRAIEKGEEIHSGLTNLQFLGNSTLLGNVLIDMYAKCGDLVKARRTLDKLPVRDVVSWNALITGYVQHGPHEEALECFEQMRGDGLFPDAVTFSCILKACGSIKAAEKGEEIHVEIARMGLLGRDTVLGNSLLDMYTKCGALAKAQQVLAELQISDTVTWNVLIAGYCQHGCNEKALAYFEQMKEEGVVPDEVTFSCLLKACGSTRAAEKGKEIHEEIVDKDLLGKSTVLGNALVDMYFKCGEIVRARQVFDELPIRDVGTWNVLVAGYFQEGYCEEALVSYEWMKESGVPPNEVTFLCSLQACGSMGAVEKGKQIHDEILRNGLLANGAVLGNALIDMYAKCDALEKAQHVFDELPIRDVVTWNVLISGYGQHKRAKEALECLERMKCQGVSPDMVTVVCCLKACGSTGAADKGEEIHAEIARLGLLVNNPALGNALVDMYAKCGELVMARGVFDSLHVRDIVTWNALIGGYSEHGHGEEALNCFERMRCDGFSPDSVTFACILKACTSIGAFDEGQVHYQSMSTIYGILPNLEHHTCMVDMLGYAGHYDKAIMVINRMPARDHHPSWIALLSACRKRGTPELGSVAFDHAIQSYEMSCADVCAHSSP